MPNLSSILEDNSGGFSSTRLMFLLWGIAVLVVWSVNSIQSGELKALPSEIVYTLGVFMTGKVAQRHFEKDPESPKTS